MHQSCQLSLVRARLEVLGGALTQAFAVVPAVVFMLDCRTMRLCSNTCSGHSGEYDNGWMNTPSHDYYRAIATFNQGSKDQVWPNKLEEDFITCVEPT